MFAFEYSENIRDITKCIVIFVEMLYKFTEEETLEGKIYLCEKCNGERKVGGFVHVNEPRVIHSNFLTLQKESAVCYLLYT
jgi:hypothetical protein